MIIPKVIHQIWEEKTTLPESFYQFSETWKEHHPSWEYIFWNKLRMDSFIQEYFPNYIPILKKYKYDVQRWDVIRYLILYNFGGVYVDFDYECLESFDNLLKDKSCCFGLEPEEHAKLFHNKIVISNAFIAIRAKHPFMKQIIDKVKSSFSVSENKLTYVLETTGPYMLTDLYEQYSAKEEISLIPSATISPLTKMDVIGYLNGEIEERYIENKISKAIAIHYFWGSWC